MKIDFRNACLSAAAISVLYGTGSVQARNLIWDPNQTGTAAGSDGSNNWDDTSLFFVDTANPGTNVAFSSANPDSVTFGTSSTVTTTAAENGIYLNANLTVQDLTLASAASGAAYSIYDQGDGNQTLTLAGNIIKTSAVGNPFIYLTNAINLTAGNHTITVKDSPGDAHPELTFDKFDQNSNALTGSGSITIDTTFNSSGFDQYGTVTFNTNNSYTGGTTISSGRLEANRNQSLGTGQVLITNAGVLGFGGSGTGTAGDLTINNNIQITRSDYSSSTAYSRYTDALVANNDGSFNTITLNGTLDVASTDARVTANTNRIIIAQPLTTSTGTGVLSLNGDFSGFIKLAANNTAFGAAGGAISINGGVEVEVNDETQLGGATSKLILNGGTIHPTGTLATSAFMTNFGTHNIGTSVGTGLNLDPGTTFTVNSLSGGGIGLRGTGTLNFQGTNTFTGTPYYDGGIVNFQAGSTTTQKGLRLRSPTVNVAGTLNVGGTYSSIGADTTGTAGGPDIAVVNVTGNGAITSNTGDDFNISDNANTKGTVNLSNNGALTVAGTLFAGKSLGAVGTINIADNSQLNTSSLVFIGQNNGTGIINQSGGSITLSRGATDPNNRNFTFVLGDGRGGTHANGTYNLSGGTFTTVAGEVYVGEGNNTSTPGTGSWIQTGGTANVNNWFVVGREGGVGTFDISAGTFNHSGGNMSMGDSNGAGGANDIINIHGTAVVNNNSGEFWVGQGGARATMTLADTAQLTVNNWLAVGRGGGTGVVNQTGGTLIKTAGSGGFLAIGSNGTGTWNQTGGVMNVYGSRIGEATSGTLNISAGTDVFTGEFSVGYNAGLVGTLNISGTANVTVPATVLGVNATTATTGGVINLNGGTLSGAGFTAGAAATRLSQMTFNGGTLKPTAANTNFIGAKVQSVVQAGGAKLDTNTFDVTINSTMAHDTALGATVDGGLTKSGAGTATLTAANTYTGTTTITGGTLKATSTTYNSNLLANSAGVALGTTGGKLVLDYTGGSSPVSTVQTILNAGYAGNFATGQIRAASTLSGGQTIGFGDNGSQVTARVTLAGDADLDGDVDFNDFLLLQANFSNPNTRFDQGNFNYDGTTNFNDFLLLQANFGQSVGFATPSYTAAEKSMIMAITSASAVPEPTSLAVIGMAAAALGSRRRRRAV